MLRDPGYIAVNVVVIVAFLVPLLPLPFIIPNVPSRLIPEVIIIGPMPALIAFVF